MPASKKTAAMTAQSGPPPVLTEVTGRAARRAPAAKKAQRVQRGAPQAPEAYKATQWGAGPSEFDVTCPSGQKALVRSLDIMRLMDMGLLDRLNGLSGIINTQVLPKAKGQRVPEVDVNELMKNADGLREVLALVDTVICEAVVLPEVYANVPDEERVEGRVYADSIGLEDKFFIFNEVTGGLDQLANFR